MIPLIIISAVILLIALLLFLPISLDIMYTDDFFMTVRFAGIRIFKIEPGNLPYHPAGDAQRKVDTGGGADSCGNRACPLHTDTLHVYTDRLKSRQKTPLKSSTAKRALGSHSAR